MEFVYIGKIVNTHGIKGELRLLSNFDKKELVFKQGVKIYIGEGHEEHTIVTYRHHKEFEMITLQGFDNINQVLKYLKMKVYVNRDDLALKAHDYLLQDLMGLEVINEGERLGKVKDIVYNGSNILFEIEGIKHFYVPNNEHFIKEVNLDKKQIEVEDVKGLML